MRARVVALLLMVGCAHSSAENHGLNQAECVILLHGLARTNKSMTTAAALLNRQGYVVSSAHQKQPRFRTTKNPNVFRRKFLVEVRRPSNQSWNRASEPRQFEKIVS